MTGGWAMIAGTVLILFILFYFVLHLIYVCFNSLRSCPFGDDPLTVEQYDEVQSLNCIGDSTGSVILTYKEESTASIPGSATTADVKVKNI
jgi:hypothetical protein